MSTVRTWIEDAVRETLWAKEIMEGDSFTRERIASMGPLLAEQVKSLELEDAPTYKGHRLLSLGKPTSMVEVGNVKCEQVVYIGDDGKFYVEGPRNRFGTTIVDIHPYGLSDAMGWGGIGLRQIADLLTTYFI
jgi:hypothetical protein